MNKPKIIIFDYGHTLCSEPGFDSLKGNNALLKHATKNPNNYTAEDISKLANDLFRNSNITKARELEVFWENVAPGEIMVNTEKLLHYLNESGIRTGVISNISFSGQALKNRLDRLLPNNKFEFVIATSEYIIRKPNPLIFELALKKANLSADEVWFCGDNTECDVKGSSSVGMFPVWYHSCIPCDYRDKSLDVRPDCEHYYLNDWLELIDVLEGLK